MRQEQKMQIQSDPRHGTTRWPMEKIPANYSAWAPNYQQRQKTIIIICAAGVQKESETSSQHIAALIPWAWYNFYQKDYKSIQPYLLTSQAGQNGS